MGAFFLTRLSRLLAIRARGSAPKSSREAGLVDRAIYSTYRDLQSLGLAGEARALLRPVRRKGRGS